MRYVKGDRVRMRSNPTQVGTVTGERDQMFLSFVGVQWDGLDFAFVPPSNLELDAPTIVGQSKPSPDGKVLTDWQTRAEAAGREASEWERSFNAERADKYMAEDDAKAWRLAAEQAEAKVERVREQLGRMSGRATDLIRAALDAPDA